MMKKRRLNIFASIFFTIFILLALNVSATIYDADAGDMITIASNDDPSANCTADDKDVYIPSGEGVKIFVDWWAYDYSTGLNLLGSNHTFQMNISGDGEAHKEAYRDLLPPLYTSDSGQLSQTFSGITENKVYYVEIACKVWDKDSSKFASNADTSTVRVFPS